ncbi:MAG: hypothetical protein ACPLPR_02375 [Bacillota bacterium]
MRITYYGTVRGFRQYALRALRKCAMRGWTLQENAKNIQRELRKAMIADLRAQILARGGDAA